MPMIDFYRTFPKLVGSDLRSMVVPPGSALPADIYTFSEYYCNDKGCDCRRVMIGVLSERRGPGEASISLGFDSDGAMPGPFLDPLNPQGSDAPELLRMFTEMINADPEYLARLQRHYVMSKERCEGRPYAGRPFEKAGRIERVASLNPTIGAADRLFPGGLPQQPVRRDAKVGRNDPCPCGSGRKYKHCCMRAGPQPRAGTASGGP